MTVHIIQTVSAKHFEVYTERLGLIGHIYDFRQGPFRFKYAKDNWMKLSYDENTAVLAAVEPKLTLLNITQRLTR